MENNRNSIDEEERAAEYGYRNFTSFAFTHYYAERKTLKECGRLLGFSHFKMRTALKSRGWPVRGQKQVPRGKPKKKRKKDIWGLTKLNTPYIFPWCAIYVYYWKYEMTTNEVGASLGVSGPLIRKLMDKYKIKKRPPRRSRRE